MIVTRIGPHLRPRIAALLVTLLAASPVGASSEARDTLEVADCMAMAREHAPGVQAAAASRQAAEIDSAAALLNRRPTFALEGSALVAPRGFYDPAVTNFGEYRLQITSAYTIRDAGVSRRERKRAALAARSARLAWRATVRDAGVQAASVAVDLLRLQADLSLLSEQVEWIDHLLDLVSQGARGGAHDQADVERLRIQRATVASDLEVAQLDRAELTRELAELIGSAPARPLWIRRPETIAALSPTLQDSLGALARVRGLHESLQAEVALTAASLDLASARGQGGLQVSLVGDAGLAGTDLTRIAPPDLADGDPSAGIGRRLKRDLGASVGIELHRPFANRERDLEASAREADYRAALRRRDDSIARSDRVVLDGLGRWRASARQLDRSASLLQQSEDNSLRMQALYLGGAAGLLDVLEARQQRDDAERLRADAEHQLMIARLRLENLQ